MRSGFGGTRSTDTTTPPSPPSSLLLLLLLLLLVAMVVFVVGMLLLLLVVIEEEEEEEDEGVGRCFAMRSAVSFALAMSLEKERRRRCNRVEGGELVNMKALG